MSKVINIYQTEDDIIVKINKIALVEVAERNPEWPIKVRHIQGFINAVVSQMENYQDSNCKETGITYLEDAMDKFMQEALVDNPEVAESMDVENM